MKTLHQFDEVFDTQAVFRKLLEAMSNPARTVSVAEQKEKLFGDYRALLALGMTLLDNEVTFSACKDEAFRKDLQLVTQKAYRRVSDMLKEEGLIDRYPEDNTPPHDVTENLLEFPAPRSARLQTMTRADTGFLSGLAYSVLRGFGQVHPTVGELRSGYVELEVAYPGREGESISLGEIFLTEVETFHSASEKDQLKLASGYGAVFGRNENKAIAMAVIDRELEQGGDYAAQDQEFVLMHGDCLEMNGFLSHLKLPHYVTFQSKLDAVRKTRRKQEHGAD